MTGGEKLDVVLAGIGGQGVVLASDILGRAAMRAGFRVRIANTHGLAQREGSVSSHVRIGRGIHGPMVRLGGADVVVGFELAEAARNLKYLSDSGVLISNSTLIYPLAHYSGHSPWPDGREILRMITDQISPDRLILLNAESLALRAGNIRTVNVVMLGVLSSLDLLPFPEEILLSEIERSVPRFAVESNLRAFEYGKSAVGGGDGETG